MKVISERALREMLRNMQSKVTCIQRPALDDFERGAEALPAIELVDLLPEVEKWRPVDQVRAQQAYRANLLRIIEGLEDEI